MLPRLLPGADPRPGHPEILEYSITDRGISEDLTSLQTVHPGRMSAEHMPAAKRRLSVNRTEP